MNKFEQLIEYVINDDDAKARELFHDIVVEKSREIYENLMNEENLEEESHDEKADDRAERDAEKVKKDLEYDFKHGRKVKEDMEEGAMGGDAADDLMHEVDMEETGMTEDDDAEFDDKAEKAGHELTHDIEDAHDEADLEDRVVDLEDKLDELMAEFESLMGDEAPQGDLDGEDMEDMAGDALAVDDTEEMMPMAENIDLKAAPAPVKSEESFVNKKAVYAANSGQAGMEAKPVNPDVGGEAKGRPAPTTKELIGKVQNTPATGGKSMSPATKPDLAQAAGVNTRTPFPKA
jgi:hypothetical protein